MNKRKEERKVEVVGVTLGQFLFVCLSRWDNHLISIMMATSNLKSQLSPILFCVSAISRPFSASMSQHNRAKRSYEELTAEKRVGVSKQMGFLIKYKRQGPVPVNELANICGVEAEAIWELVECERPGKQSRYFFTVIGDEMCVDHHKRARQEEASNSNETEAEPEVQKPETEEPDEEEPEAETELQKPETDQPFSKKELLDAEMDVYREFGPEVMERFPRRGSRPVFFPELETIPCAQALRQPVEDAATKSKRIIDARLEVLAAGSGEDPAAKEDEAFVIVSD